MPALSLRRRLRAWPLWAALGFVGLGAVAIVDVKSWSPGLSATPDQLGQNAPQRRVLTVSTTPVMVTLNEVGLIQPGSRMAVTAPFDGYVRQIRNNVGARVEIGDVLLVLDSSEIDARAREAEAALLKAKAAVDSLQKWNSGAEVSRAKRGVATATSQLANLKRQEKQAKGLLDRGIISRNEYDGIAQQVASQDDQVAAAQQDLDTTIDRGNADNQRVAQLDLMTARAHLDEVLVQKGQDVVRATKPGILMQPPSTSTEHTDNTQVDEGSHVTRGQAVLVVANLDTLIAEMRVDEVDVNQLHIGQPVTIESDSFPGEKLRGELVSVGGEAERGGNLGGSAHFLVQARFVVDEKRRAAVRVGMSARLTITAYENSQAFVIPAEAIASVDGRYTVQVLDPHTEAVHPVMIKTGTTTPSGIEIIDGLKDGDKILISTP